jgi:tetratricopeptide (TPR) repeat protein/tRNA A-37 threonylcarbamoyl transferase component Bud32
MATANANRNLLLGILALQNNFIDQKALLAALNAWVLEKDRPMGQILRALGVLDRETEALLEALVQRHLHLHGNDPEQSLAAVSTLGSVREKLQQIADPDLHASLAHVSTAGGPEDDSYGTQAPSSGTPTSSGPRFRILRPHAKGGLGQISVAEDQELHREVALKEIQDRHADNPESRSRFVLEAEITGGLEHPGIVPVYGLGQYADGRPFYAMRFIRGDSLNEAIQRFHRAEVPGRDPSERSLTLRHLLGRFVDVCNAVAYAHSRGVLHRDLKPGNIMLGKYGETLVVDWGLAKSVDRPASTRITDEAPLRPSSGSGVAATLTGSAIGTPAFMSPEQALGRWDLVGPASDIYSLGATLYSLLTGRAPFEDREVGIVLQQVQKGDYLPPRQVKPATPVALDAICRKAMALEPGDRYATALALAADVEHWLADEPVSALREPLVTRLARWGRRHKPAVAGAAALLLTAVVALAVSNVLVAREQARTDEARLRAEEHFADAREAVDLMLTRVGQERLANEPRMEKVRRDLLENALQFYQRFLDEKSRDPDVRFETVRAFQRVGDIQEMLGDHAKAEKAHCSAVAFLEELIAEKPREPKYRKALASNQNELAVVLHAAGRRADAEKAYQYTVTIRTKLVEDFPDEPDYRFDLGASYNDRAIFLQTNNQLPQAEQAYKQAVELLVRLTDKHAAQLDYQVVLARTYTNFGGLLTQQGRHPEARESYQRALQIQQHLVSRQQEVVTHQKELGRTDLNLGLLEHVQGHRDEAEKSYRKAVDVFTDLAEKFSNNPDYRSLLAESYKNLGLLLASDPRKAEPAWRQAMALYGKLAGDFNHEANYRRQQAISLNELAIVLAATGRTPEAEQSWVAARDIQEQLIAPYSADSGYWPELINTYVNLTELYQALDRSRDVEMNYHRFVNILERRIDAFPKVPDYKHEMGVALNDFGTFLLRRDKLVEASRYLHEAIRYQRAAVKGNSQKASFRLALCGHYLSLGDARVQLEDHAGTAQAIADLLEVAPATWPDYPRAAGLQARCIRLAQQDKKVADTRRPELVQRYGDQVVVLLQRALAQGYTDSNYLKKTADFEPLRSREDFKKLLSELDTRIPSERK